MLLQGVLLLCALAEFRADADAPPRHHRSVSIGPAQSTYNNSGGSSNGAPITETECGRYRGSWMESRRGRQFESYRGIRYAVPPVGELRFQPPKAVERCVGDVDASEEGPACPRPTRKPYYVEEDCLRLNVYTPKNHNLPHSLPVLVFIHAGGFYSMSGRSDVAGPHYLLDRDVVLVTMNYRLASFGFISTGDELAPGNNGLKDQVVALQWIQKNIAAFGGDPHLVTIFGCSAGSNSIMLHMISPMSRNLFHRAMSMSGSPTSKVPLDRHQRHLAVKQAELVGCPTNTTAAILDCLKTKPWQDIANTLDSFFEFGYDPLNIWRPIVEPDFGQERFLPIEPMDAIREGKTHSVPYIISQTRDEFFWKAYFILNNDTLRTNMSNNWEKIAPISFILPRNNASYPSQRLRESYLHDRALVRDQEVTDGLGKLYGDAITGFPVHRLANLMCRHSAHPVWYYEFSYIGNRSHYEDENTTKPVGVAHHDDLIYLLSLRYRFPDIPYDGSQDSVLVNRMTGILYTLAVHGNPNDSDLPELSSLSWPAMTPDTRQYLRIGDDFQVHEKLKEDRFNLWEELYPIQY